MPHEPRKKPTQRRAAVTVDVILEATARILASDGLRGLSTNRIARVAGVSVGSVYQYFPDRDAIVAALVDRRLAGDAEAVAVALAAAHEAPLRERIRAVIGVIVRRQHEAAPWLARLLPALAALEREVRAVQVVAETEAQVTAWLLAEPSALREELRAPERLAVALSTTTRAVRGALNAAAVEAPARLADPVMVDVLVRMVEAALLAPPEAPTP